MKKDHQKHKFLLLLKDLEKYMFVCGATGTSKSNFLRKEYGSPVEPQIPEAEILYHLDSLDAKYRKGN